MDAMAKRQETKIASWGNSDGIRIPRSVMRQGGFASGDKVDVFINEHGNIEIEHAQSKSGHRKVRPANGISFDTLFKDYAPTDEPATDPWPEDMLGAEMDAWSE